MCVNITSLQRNNVKEIYKSLIQLERQHDRWFDNFKMFSPQNTKASTYQAFIARGIKVCLYRTLGPAVNAVNRHTILKISFSFNPSFLWKCFWFTYWSWGCLVMGVGDCLSMVYVWAVPWCGDGALCWCCDTGCCETPGLYCWVLGGCCCFCWYIGCGKQRIWIITRSTVLQVKKLLLHI